MILVNALKFYISESSQNSKETNTAGASKFGEKVNTWITEMLISASSGHVCVIYIVLRNGSFHNSPVIS